MQHNVRNLLVSSLFSLALAPGFVAAQPVFTVHPDSCPAGLRNCFETGEGLQQALATIPDGGTVRLEPGVYTYPGSPEAVKMINRFCDNEENGGGHLGTTWTLAHRDEVTIESTTGVASDVVLLGGGDQVHALTLDHSTNAVIYGISIFSNGNVAGNGIGDAALNVVNSTGVLRRSIVSGNKATSGDFPNPRLPDPVDQEGVVLYGPDTHFILAANLIVNNFHTGVMLLDGARAMVWGNYFARNGHDGGNEGKGHAVTTFDFSEITTCYDGNMELDLQNNLIADNSGFGILLRGRFSGSENQVRVAHNTISDNHVGLRIGPSSWGIHGEVHDGVRKVGVTSWSDGAGLLVANNVILENLFSGVKVVQEPNLISGDGRRGGLWLDPGSVEILNNAGFGNKPGADFVQPSGEGVEREFNLCTSPEVCPTCPGDCFEPIDDPELGSRFEPLAGSPLAASGFPCPWGSSCADISSYDSYLGTTPFPDHFVLSDLCTTYPTAAARLGTGGTPPACSF